MSPEQDNDLLTMAVEDSLLAKRKLPRVALVGTGRIMSDLASLLAISQLRAMKPILHLALETDLAEVERRMQVAVMEDQSELIGFSPYSVRMLMPKFPDPEVMVAPLKKEPKHWEKFNKKRKNGRW